MKYIYAALLLHESGKEINEENMKRVMEVIGEIDDARIKTVVESLKGVNIEEVTKTALLLPSQPISTEEKEVKKEEKKEEKREEVAAEGLAALFG